LPEGKSKNPTDGAQATKLMSFTVFLGNLPTWVTADDIKQWLSAEDLVSDSVKVIRNHETQESKGFAFVEAPTQDEMQAIIRRFDRAPLEDKILRANPAQPTKGGPVGKTGAGAPRVDSPRGGRSDRRAGSGGATRRRDSEPKSAFATELAKAL
jgi:RNA recognition motif-containing protein